MIATPRRSRPRHPNRARLSARVGSLKLPGLEIKVGSHRVADSANPDVCVVGAGPAGLCVALSLSEAGRRVIVLESGGHRSSRRAQQLNDGDLVGEPYSGLIRTRHRQVGGTANSWNVPVQGERGAKYVPLSPRDMVDWPLAWEELEEHYVPAQRFCGLGPFEYGARYWATETRAPFPLEGTGLENGVYQFGSAKWFTRALVERLLARNTINLVPSATLIGFDSGRDRIEAVRAIDRLGRTLEVKARVVVLACGAVENARLLMLAGQGGDSRWLGRGFMEHARDFSMVLVPDDPDVFTRAAFYDLHQSDDGVLIGGRVAPTDDALVEYGLPNASMTLIPRPRSRTVRGEIDRALRSMHHAIGVPWRGRYGWSTVRSPATAFDVFRTVLNLEQRPNPSNRIELGGRKDRFGNPLPRLVLHWTDQEQEQLDRLRELYARWFRSAGLGRLTFNPGHRPDLSAHHHAGTTRMGLSSQDGVVDPDCRVFGCDNLYLAGASVFPTAGFANPVLTVVAMSLRLAKTIDFSLD